MTYSSFYKYAAIALLLINLGLLSFIYIGHKPPPPENGERLSAKERLNLDESQHEQFLKIVEIHHERIDSIKNAQSELLERHFDKASNQSQSDLEQLTQLEILKLKEVEQHFEDIKGILNPKQLTDFQSFKEFVIKSITNSDRKIPEHRRNR